MQIKLNPSSEECKNVANLLLILAIIIIERATWTTFMPEKVVTDW